MRVLFLSCVGVAIASLVLWKPARAVPPETGTGDWEAVYRAVEQKLPEVAVEQLQRLLRSAIERKDHPRAIRALCLRVRYQHDFESQYPERRIVALEKALSRMPEAMRPVLHVIIASWYAEYYQKRDRLFWNGAPTSTADQGDDLVNWSTRRLVRELKRHVDAAVAEADMFKEIPISRYASVMEPPSLPYPYRQTVFDVLVHQAIDSYQTVQFTNFLPNGLPAAALTEASPALGTAADFLAWKIDPASPFPQYQILRLYQILLRFHQHDHDRSAWLDVNFQRLMYGATIVRGSAARKRYGAALEHFIMESADHPIVTRALCERAMLYLESGDLTAALQTARRGTGIFAGSVGNQRCRELIRELKRPRFTIETESVWNGDWSRIRIHYRNVDAISFRLVPVSLEECLEAGSEIGKVSPKLVAITKRHEFFYRQPTRQWSVELPPVKDHAMGTHEVAVPNGIANGPYVLLASTEHLNIRPDNTAVLGVWRSDLSLLVCDRDATVVEGIVTDSTTGMPLSGVDVIIYDSAPPQSMKKLAAGRTDRNGRFHLATSERDVLIRVRQADDELLTHVERWGTFPKQKAQEDVNDYVLFTDRAIYRPGETVHYKGIAFRYNEFKSRYGVLDHDTVTVVLLDANNRELARHSHRTNAYGSFHGSFQTPRSKVPARVNIGIQGRRPAATIRVEENRRTTRRVSADKPQEPARRGKRKLVARLEVVGSPTVNQPIPCDTVVRYCTGSPAAGVKGILRVFRLKEPPHPVDVPLYVREHDRWTNGPPGPTGAHLWQWKTGSMVKMYHVRTDQTGRIRTSLELGAGAYRITFETNDEQEHRAETQLSFVVLDPNAKRFPARIPFFADSSHRKAHVGESVAIVWGSGYETARAYVEVQHGREILQRFWTDPDRTQQVMHLRITPQMRGGIAVRVLMVGNGQLYDDVFGIEVPWDDQRLALKWDRFQSNLSPNQRTTWTIKVEPPPGEQQVDAELVATIYDASLDRRHPHSWAGFRRLFDPYGRGSDAEDVELRFSNIAVSDRYPLPNKIRHGKLSPFRYPGISAELAFSNGNRDRNEVFGNRLRYRQGWNYTFRTASSWGTDETGPRSVRADCPSSRRLNVARQSSVEKAFFFSHIKTGPDGTAQITFTPPAMPTSWRILVFAHDRKLRWGSLEATAKTDAGDRAPVGPPHPRR